MEQREAGDAYSVFEHVNTPVAIERELFGDGIEERCHVTVIVPYEIVTHCCHLVVVPVGLSASVIGIGYFLALQLTVERGLRW